jgi:type IV pilus assembly protein PilE
MNTAPLFAAPMRRARGFTTLELLVAVSISAVLSSVAYPSFKDQIAKAHRADAFAAVTNAQMAQERWRANQTAYASLGDLGIAAVSSAGHYTLQIAANTATGYEILATARGRQTQDAQCRNLRLTVAGANFDYASGPDASTANPAPINRRCWSL